MSDLHFTPAKHAYRYKGKPIPGVTTLLGKGLPKPALVYWSAKTVAEYVAANYESVGDMLRTGGAGPTIGFLKQTPWQKRDEAAIRGSEIHALAEKVVAGEEVEVPDQIHGYVEGYARWLDAFDVKPERTEYACYSVKNYYAGTADFRGWIAGRHCVADWKSSRGVYGSMGAQVAAYDNAEWWVDGDVDKPNEPTGNLCIVHIQDGLTEHRWVKDPEQIYRRWLHIAYVGKSIDLIDGCLDEPVTYPETEGAA